jgi:hypothetical protein
MPLASPVLASQLQTLFVSPPPDVPGCARAWANATVAYATAIVPASTTVSTAGDALAGSLASAFSSPAAAPLMEVAFLQFATAVGLGMAGFAPVPPPAPIGFAQQFAGPKPETHADAAQQVAAIIDTWMHTGVSTLLVPPFTPLPWS